LGGSSSTIDGDVTPNVIVSLALWQVVHHGWKQPLRNQRPEYPTPFEKIFSKSFSPTGTGFWCLILLELYLGVNQHQPVHHEGWIVSGL
jgi:hypothetical protein